MLCLVCNEDIFQWDDIKCLKCKKYLHFSCGGMRETNFRKLAGANKEKWCCAKCKSMIINTGIRQEVDSSVGSNETLANLTESVKFMSNQFDNFGKQLSKVLNFIKELKEENKSLKETNCKLKVDISSLTKKINVLEQNAIISNVEIIGVPEQKNENCVEVVQNIATKLGVKLSVLNAFRMYSKYSDRLKKIIAKINSSEDKQQLMDFAKKRKLSTKHLNENWENGNIFINNELTAFNRDLFYKTRMFAKSNNFKFVWFKDLKIFLKKDENSKAYIVQDDLDLSKLL